MHESTLARELVRMAVSHAEAAGAVRVTVVSAWAAETEALSEDTLRLHFAAVAAGTIAEGARLDVRLTRVAARCRACGATYEPDHHVVLCDACGSTDADLLGETGLGVSAIEVA